jgi:predicted DNA-binding ribbon-helix-helix protein
MSGLPVKRSVKIAGHATSVTLEPEFWDCLRDMAAERNQSINQMVAEIDCSREANLSSAIRVFVLNELKRKAAG